MNAHEQWVGVGGTALDCFMPFHHNLLGHSWQLISSSSSSANATHVVPWAPLFVHFISSLHAPPWRAKTQNAQFFTATPSDA